MNLSHCVARILVLCCPALLKPSGLRIWVRAVVDPKFNIDNPNTEKICKKDNLIQNQGRSSCGPTEEYISFERCPVLPAWALGELAIWQKQARVAREQAVAIKCRHLFHLANFLCRDLASLQETCWRGTRSVSADMASSGPMPRQYPSAYANIESVHDWVVLTIGVTPLSSLIKISVPHMT